MPQNQPKDDKSVPWFIFSSNHQDLVYCRPKSKTQPGLKLHGLKGVDEYQTHSTNFLGATLNLNPKQYTPQQW